MKPRFQVIDRRIERTALALAGAGAVVGLALTVHRLAEAALAYRFALFACLAPSVGCMVFTLIHRTTGGHWARPLRPFLRAGASILPWVWLGSAPLLLLELAPNSGGPGYAASGYGSLPMVAVRACLFAAVFFGLRWAVNLEAGSDAEPRLNRHPWVGPVGLIVLVFTLTFLADDWIEALQPGWHSTAFPIVWMAGQSVSGLALAILCGLASGARPAEPVEAERPLGNDWGNLLLATVFFWTYVAFGQFLIIWSGNLPDEISWFIRREEGAWALVAPALALGNFLVPFLLLLSRQLKTRAKGLAAVAGALLAGQVVYDAWLFLPAAGPTSVAGIGLAASFLAAGIGLFARGFVRTARLSTGVSYERP